MVLCPPTIVEEVSVCSTQVRLRGQLRGAKVQVFADSDPNPLVESTAEWPDQWFALRPGVTLSPGQILRARQELGGDSSVLSTDGSTVQDRSTTVPYFAPPLVGCSSIAVVEDLAPGAAVMIADASNAPVGNQVAPGTRAVVKLSRTVNNGERLTATSSACGAPAAAAKSTAAEPMRLQGEELSVPKLAIAIECQRVLVFTNVRVGAKLILSRVTGTAQWTCSAPELRGRIDPPLVKNENLEFWQEPPARSCEVRRSPSGTATVSGGPPGAPLVTTKPCPGSRWLALGGLVPTATVKIQADGTDVCMFEAADPYQTVDLGNVALTAGQSLTAVQGLCGVFGPASPVPSWVTLPPLTAAPALPEHLFACATVVRVSGLAGASRVSLFSDKLKGRIGYALTEDSSVDVSVTPSLIVGDRVYAVVSGCSSGSAAREVEPTPDIPPFRVTIPRDGDVSVRVQDLLPGCRVDVYVDGHWGGGASAGGTDVRIGVSDPLRERQQVIVGVRMCQQERTAAAVTVLPPLSIAWMRPSGLALQMNTGHWMSGRVMAAILWPGRALLGTEEGGLWLATPTGIAAPLSLDWPTPLIRSLLEGPRGPEHVYCGTTNGIMESDTTKPVPLLSWVPVNGVPQAGGPGGVVSDLLVVQNRLFVATNVGLWWSVIPATPGAGYGWQTDPVVSQANVLSICEGPNGSIVGYGRTAMGGVLFRGALSAAQWQWSVVTPGTPVPVTDSRLTTVVQRMANGRVHSCESDRSRVCAVFEDGNDNAWLAMLRSDDGGATWSIPYADPGLKYFKPGGTVDMGYQAERNLDIALHPLKRDSILLIARRGGLLGSTDGGVTWDTGTWPAVLDGSFHGDSMCLAFDRSDPARNTVLVGGDGGAFLSTDFGRTWNTDYNQTLTTLMFDQQGFSSAPALSASEAYTGLVVGAFQDNGKAYLRADGEPWRELGRVGDGQRALFVTGDILMNGGNDDVDLKWARWDGNAFVDEVTLEPVGYPPNTSFMPFMARIPYPGRKDGAGALMVAVAGDNQVTGNVWGLFDRGTAHSPRSERMYWQKLGTVEGQTTAIASLSGHIVVVGSVEGSTATHLYLLDSTTGKAIEMQLPANLALGNPPRWLTLCDASTAFVLFGNELLRTTDMATWVRVPVGLAGSLNVITVDWGDDPARLLLAGSDGVWSSRDLGATWVATAGQPRHPQANHLEVVGYANGSRVAHMGTWNWGLWRAPLS